MFFYHSGIHCAVLAGMHGCFFPIISRTLSLFWNPLALDSKILLLMVQEFQRKLSRELRSCWILSGTISMLSDSATITYRLKISNTRYMSSPNIKRLNRNYFSWCFSFSELSTTECCRKDAGIRLPQWRSQRLFSRHFPVLNAWDTKDPFSSPCVLLS